MDRPGDRCGVDSVIHEVGMGCPRFQAVEAVGRQVDQDGLLAIPPADVPLLIDKARAVLAAEAETMRAMQEDRWDRSFIDALEARCNN